jgi:putative transposase
MLKAFKYRICPSKSQAELINKHIGSARFVYNLALETKSNVYKSGNINLSCYELINQLPELKKECEWLKEVNSQTLQATIKNLDTAYKNFFRKSGFGYPKYKSKWRGDQSFNIPQHIKLKNGRLYIPKFKEGIKINLHRNIKGSIRQATISRTPTGKYFVSILCETYEEKLPKKPVYNILGIDVGIKDFLVTNKGLKIPNPKHLYMLENRIKYIQRKYSKHKGKKTKQLLARLHERVANRRKDFLHQLSSKLVSENQSLAIEDLHVKGMLKNHKLAKSISDVGWGMFITMLMYKCDWYGTNLIKIGRFDPSSKTCSNCGNINDDLTLNIREWICNNCSAEHDRDINAAINIKDFALKMVSGTDTKNQDELPTLVGV